MAEILVGKSDLVKALDTARYRLDGHRKVQEKAIKSQTNYIMDAFDDLDLIDVADSSNYIWSSDEAFINSNSNSIAIIQSRVNTLLSQENEIMLQWGGNVNSGTISTFISRDSGVTFSEVLTQEVWVDISDQPAGTSMVLKSNLTQDSQLYWWALHIKDASMKTFSGFSSDEKTMPSASVRMFKNYIAGLQLEYVSASQVKIKDGQCRSHDDTEDIYNTSDLIIDISTTGVNGLDAGSEAANVWYFVYIIKNSTTGQVAGLLSTSSTSPTMPGQYDQRRRIGTIRNNASSNLLNLFCKANGNIREIIWVEDIPTTLQMLTNGDNTSWTEVDISNLVPNTAVSAAIQMVEHKGEGRGYVRPKGTTVKMLRTTKQDSVLANVYLNGYQSIEYYVTKSNCELDIAVAGFTEEV